MTQRAHSQSDWPAPLDAFDGLLSALAPGIDLRDTFCDFSAAASPIVPHDEANLWLLSADGSTVQLYATTGDAMVVGAGREASDAIINVKEPQLLDDVPGPQRGLRSGLTVPIMVDRHAVGSLALLSRAPHAYSDRDLKQAGRLAKYLGLGVSHQRLAEQARDAAVEQAGFTVESSMELLRAIADVLDVRTVFPRISEIANKMLPHDALTMAFFDENGIRREAFSTDLFPEMPPLVQARVPTANEIIVHDIETEALPIDNPDVRDRLVRAGFRSFLGIIARARDQVMSVTFFSKRPGMFQARDVPVARRITDHIALAVSHEQLTEAARQIAEARGRAERLEARVQLLSDELESKTLARVVGQSVQWRDVLKKATQVAATDTTVLLAGESGTGKEVVARFIHRASTRSKGPFVALNCAALPEQLLESELFGYERGAFTSAQQAKPGQIELASGGTLFLDEVSEMSLSAQAKFLRVLQEREFQRLGGTRMLKANVRVIAATNRDLRKAVERGTFREDLFYRLSVFNILIAPLRERPDDVLPLSEVFLQEIGRSFGRPPAGLSKSARVAVLEYHWPGNVRELHNALERAAILCEGGLIHAEHLALQDATKATASASVSATTSDLDALERETMTRVLRECRWNKSKAAKRLGLTRTKLYTRMKKYGLVEDPPNASD